MASAMNSKIYLYQGVKLDRNHEEVLNISTTDLITALSSNLVVSANNYSFIRERGSIKVNFSYAQCVVCNYMIYQNPTYANKYFCAFVDSIEYINDATVEIFFTIDLWQTWFSDMVFHSVYVEREHISGDYRGANVIPEPINPSQMIVDEVHRLDLNNYCIIVAYTTTKTEDSPSCYMAGEMVSGAKIKKFNTRSLDYISGNWIPDLSDFYDFIESFQGDYESIVSIFIYPSLLVDIHDSSADNTQYGEVKYIELNVPLVNMLQNYTPKNQKCFTYPYMQLMADNGEAYNIYKPELFLQNSAVVPAISGYTFRAYGCAMPTAEIDLFPMYYNGFNGGNGVGETGDLLLNRTEKLPMNQFPQIAFPIDTYKSWIAQAQSTALYGILGGMLTGGLGGAMGGSAEAGLVGSASAGMSGVINELLTENRMKEASNKWSGSQGGSIDLAMDILEFDIKVLCPPKEELKVIDDYFSMFGYATKRVKIPNISTRQNWNYIKVKGQFATGNAPAEAISLINDIANRGVTIWHSYSVLGNYGSMVNPEVI